MEKQLLMDILNELRIANKSLEESIALQTQQVELIKKAQDGTMNPSDMREALNNLPQIKDNPVLQSMMKNMFPDIKKKGD